VIPSTRALAALGLAGVALVAGFAEPVLGAIALVADALLLAAVVIDARRAATDLGVQRVVPDAAHQGERLVGEILLENPSEADVRFRLRDPLAPELGEGLDLSGIVPRGSRVREPFERTAVFRGNADLGHATLRVLGPWGLGWRQRTVPSATCVRVLPRVHLAGEAGLLLRRELQWRVGRHATERKGVSTELYALREYLPGDDVRRVDWKATARHRKPVVREDTLEQHQNLVVLLDAGRPMASRADGLSKLDHGLSAALALLRVAVARNDSATLAVFSKGMRRVVRVDRRTRSFGGVLDALYAEHADLDEPDYAGAVAWCSRRLPRRSIVLVCTSLVDMTGADRLGAALGRLGRRHVPLLVNLEDPGLLKLASCSPGGPEEAFAKVSAMGLVDQNKALSHRLRAAGVRVVSRPASGLALGMLGAYLDAR